MNKAQIEERVNKMKDQSYARWTSREYKIKVVKLIDHFSDKKLNISKLLRYAIDFLYDSTFNK